MSRLEYPLVPHQHTQKVVPGDFLGAGRGEDDRVDWPDATALVVCCGEKGSVGCELLGARDGFGLVVCQPGRLEYSHHSCIRVAKGRNKTSCIFKKNDIISFLGFFELFTVFGFLIFSKHCARAELNYG